MPDPGTPLEAVLARNMRELRLEKGWTQSDLAQRMQLTGFTSQTNRVGQVETIRRPISLLELIGLSWTFAVPVQFFFRGDAQIELPAGGTAPLADVRRFLTASDTGTHLDRR